MMVVERNEQWVIKATKLGYTLFSEERERQYQQAQVATPQWEIDSED